MQAFAAGVIAERAMRGSASAEAAELWPVVVALDVTTVFSRFQVNATTGEQIGHASVLTRWRGGDALVLDLCR